jgi:predicted ATP-dependent serine protease
MSYYCSDCVVNYETDDGQCPTCGGDTVLEQAPAAVSPLELAETAHMAARLCWLWPDDHEQRLAAVQACEAVNVDYIEALAKVMHDTGASAHTARRQLAEALRRAADHIYAHEGQAR